MPRGKTDHAQAVRDVKASWETRGYRADYLAIRQNENDDDPYGELAYQRAFAEAVKKDPPRLPNPSHYPHSPSAQAFLQQRAKEFFNSRPASDAPNPKYESPIPDFWRTREDAGATSPPPPPPSQQSQQPQQTGMPPPPPPPTPQQQSGFVQVNGTTYQQPSPISSRVLPSPMEPKMGAPMGPPSRFR